MICAVTYFWLQAGITLTQACQPPTHLTHDHFECMTYEAQAENSDEVILSARFCFEKGADFPLM